MKSSIAAILVIAATVTASAQPGAQQPMPPAEQPPPPPQDPRSVDAMIDQVLPHLEAAAPSIEKVALGTLRRARRAVSFGPTVGVWAGRLNGSGDFDQAITFGLAFEMFKIPILPDPETIKALVFERVKAKLKDQILSRLQGRQPAPLELEQMAREVYQEVRDEVLGEKNVRPKTMERPKLNIALEANRLFQSTDWLGRLRIGVGVWKFTLGGSLAFRIDDDRFLYAGPELVTHFLVSKNPRASVVDVFVRADWELGSRDTNDDHIVLGARFLLDVI